MIRKILNSNTVWALISTIVNTGIHFLIVPYVSENVGIEAYGFVSLANMLVTYADVISTALNSFAGRYIAIEYHKGNIEKAKRYYTSVFIGDLLITLGLALVAVYAIPQLQLIINISEYLQKDVKILFAIVVARYCLVMLRTAFDVSAFIKNRLDLSEKLRTCSHIINASVLLYTCCVLKPHVWYVGLATLCSVTFLLITQIVVSRKHTPELRIEFRLFSPACIRDFLLSGIWNSINSVGNMLNSGLDLLITNQMLSGVLMGAVSVSKTMGSLCYTIIIAISNSLRPKQLEYYSKHNIEALVNRLIDSMRITGCVCALIFSGFYSVGYEFLSLWLPSQNLSLIFRLMMIVIVGDVVTGVVYPLFYVFTLTNKLKVPCVITILMGALNVIGMYILIKYTDLGSYAVVLTTMVLNLIHFIDTPIYSAHCLQLSYKTFYPTIVNHLLDCGINMLVMRAVGSCLVFTWGWYGFILKVIILGFFGIVVSFFVVASKAEREAVIRGVLQKYRI